MPNGYWKDRRHQRRYLYWLARRLGYRTLDDWYRITTDDFKHNRGGSPLALCWNSSAVRAVKACFPQRDWKEWRFTVCPRGFWRSSANRRRYMVWLGGQLGIRHPSGWYRVTNRDFMDHCGGAFLLEYSSTVSRAVMETFPGHAWKEWLFDMTPKGFWKKRKNRLRYLRWLAKQLGLKKPDDWYSITANQFKDNHGLELLRLYGMSPARVVMGCFRHRRWVPWLFNKVPAGFWDKRQNRRQYVEWLGRRLRIRTVDDWRTITRADFQRNRGGALLQHIWSVRALLDEALPEIKRRGDKALRR